MMSNDIAEKLRERQHIAKQMKITPYPIVKKNLDEVAATTAKQAAAGLVELFEHLGEKAQ